MRQSPPTNQPAYSSVTTGISTFANTNARPMNFMMVMLLSILLHLSFIGLISLTVFLLNFFGFTIPLFQSLEMKERDIEFVLVENPEAPPRDKHTKNRADRATRSGGQKIKNMAQAEPQKAAGSVSAKATPQRPQQQAKPKQQPKQTQAPKQAQQPQKVVQQRPAPVQRPQQQPRKQPTREQPTRTVQVTKPPQDPTPSETPVEQPAPPKKIASVAPPSPKLPTMKTPQADAPILPPNPVAPTIKTPSAPAPKTVATGPIVNAPGIGNNNGGSSSSGSVGPTQIPGGISGRPSGGNSGASGGSPSSGGGHPSIASGSPGSRGGNNGRSGQNQVGSPGGGGGRPGIDAMPEPDFGPYISELQRRIKRNWNPPSDDRDKRIVALFTIARDGRLLSLRIQNSSGVKVADEAALNAVRASAPFRQLPANFRGNDIDVQFIFDYNVYRGKSSGITYSQ